jgi:hypothetical protein
MLNGKRKFIQRNQLSIVQSYCPLNQQKERFLKSSLSEWFWSKEKPILTALVDLVKLSHSVIILTSHPILCLQDPNTSSTGPCNSKWMRPKSIGFACASNQIIVRFVMALIKKRTYKLLFIHKLNSCRFLFH